ncbi:uncharacterized protein [Panulirus ornatus]
MSLPATRPQTVSFDVQPKPGPKSEEFHETVESPPLVSPPSSGYSTPTGRCTPSGYFTSAPSSPEGPSKRRKKGRPAHSSSREELDAREMVEAGGSRAGKGKMTWRPRQEPPSQRTVPPWAEPNAQPPPPPTQLYAHVSPPSTRRPIKPITPMSTATEANPTPTHFNRPTAGSSPIMARRSLFRGTNPPRARSVDSLTSSVPWAEHKLRPIPRTDSPSRATPVTDTPSWAAPPSDPSSQRISRRDIPSRRAPAPDASTQVSPSPNVSSQTQAAQSPDLPSQKAPTASSQAAPLVDTSSRELLTVESSCRSTEVSSFTREVEMRESTVVTARHQSQAVMRPPHTPRDSSAAHCAPREAPWRVPGEVGATGLGGQGASVGQAAPRPQPGGQPSEQPSVEVIHRPARGPDAPHQSSSTMVSVKPQQEGQPTPGSRPQEQTSPTPWRKNVGGSVAAAKAGPTEQQIPPAGGTRDDASAVSSGGDLASSASAPSEGQAPQQPPWRRPAGPAQQEVTGPPPAAAQATQDPSKSVVKGHDKVKKKTGAAQVADSQPNWRKQQPKRRPAAAASAAAAAAAPHTPPPASSMPQDATSQSPAAADTVKPAATTPAVTPAAVGKPVSSVTSFANKSVLTAVDNSSTLVPAANKLVSPPPSADKLASPVPAVADKLASPVPAADKLVSPVPPPPAANKPVSPVPAADKLAPPPPPASKPVSPVPTADKLAPPSPPANKPVSPVPAADKLAPPPPPANKPMSPVPAADKLAPAPAAADKPPSKRAPAVPASKSTTSTPISKPATSAAPLSVKLPSPATSAPVLPASVTSNETQGPTAAASAPSAPLVTVAAKTPGVPAAQPKVGSDTEARWATSPPLAPLPTTTLSHTPPLPSRQSAAQIVGAPVVPQAPKPAATTVTAAAEPAPSATTSVITAEAAPPPPPPPPPPPAVSGPGSGPRASGADPAKVLAEGVTTALPTMPIPTPPPAPAAKLVKTDGVAAVYSETTGTSKSGPGVTDSKDATVLAQPEGPTTGPAAVVKPTEAVKPPYPDFPPPPPVEDIAVPPQPSECEPGLPPPPSLLQEERIPPPLSFTTQLKELTEEDEMDDIPSPEYVRESVTKRIKAFEKQASKEEEPSPTERHTMPARPVAPWVKRTSSGPVQQQSYWDMTSPEEPDICLSSPPPQREAERTKSPSRPPAPAKEPPKAAIIPAPPAPSPVKVAAPPSTSPGSKVSPLPATGKVAPPRPRPAFPRRRSASTGDYQAQYITPDETLRQIKMPAEGSTSAQISPDAGVAPAPAKDDVLTDPWCDPKNPRTITFQDVSAAAFKIKSGIMNTPCTRSHMSSFTDMEIFFKKEFNQYTGSFKERGARYTLLMLSKEQQKKGVIAASAGNHALALCYHGQDLGIPITVVMPLVAPIMKVQACRQYGANIIVKGKDIGECREYALRIAKEQDLLYVNGYDHPHILAGQGTMGLEIVEQVPNIDAVIIPVGGAGLIAGVALAVKALYPHIQVIGVESERCASFSAAMKAGRPVYVKAESTLADGLAVPMVGVNAFATASNLVDKVVTVREEWIAISILRLVECEKAVVEGAGATALAAVLAGELSELKGKRVVIPLCGGNIDTTVLGRCLERGLAADGRLVKFTVTVSDRPGGIAELTRLLANLGVSIKDMVHERAWIRSDIFSVEVKVMAETKDYDHFLELKSALEMRYEKVRFAMPDQIHEDTNF